MPDGESKPWVEAFDTAAPDTTLIDISFDHRLDAGWVYGLPELNRDRITGSRRIANPGCYATALQLAIAPLLESLRADPVVFGVSGYSGAGTTPGPRNDPAKLADNLIPYRLTGHNHEVESTNNLGRPVRFMPHVHQAFRGLLVTVSMSLTTPTTEIELENEFRDFYAGERLVEIRTEPPELRDGAGNPGVIIGGFTVAADGREIVVVAAEDNLLKGAAVQAFQNLNLALGFPELTGIA
jgi:N-acetyl-gamma-glutamyl-phosphate reductase